MPSAELALTPVLARRELYHSALPVPRLWGLQYLYFRQRFHPPLPSQLAPVSPGARWISPRGALSDLRGDLDLAAPPSPGKGSDVSLVAQVSRTPQRFAGPASSPEGKLPVPTICNLADYSEPVKSFSKILRGGPRRGDRTPDLVLVRDPLYLAELSVDGARPGTRTRKPSACETAALPN